MSSVPGGQDGQLCKEGGIIDDDAYQEYQDGRRGQRLSQQSGIVFPGEYLILESEYQLY